MNTTKMSGYFIRGTALMKFHVKMSKNRQGRTNGGIKGFISQNCQNLDLKTDGEYVDNLVNFNM